MALCLESAATRLGDAATSKNRPDRAWTGVKRGVSLALLAATAPGLFVATASRAWGSDTSAAPATAAPAAAENSSPAATPAASTDDGNSIQEVVVTARLRNEKATETPTIVTALSGEQLTQQGITTMQGLADAIPNVSITPYFLTDAIYIRGIGNNGLQAGFEQQAGLFIDGVYYGNGNWINGGLMDIESAEVLEGPQGAYFGKNTIAGAFNIHTADPTQVLSAAVRAGYEFEAGERYVNAYVSGPVTDTLGVRLAVYASKMDGWAETVGGNDEPGSRSEVARLTLAWKPTDDFDANLKGQVSQYRDNGVFEIGSLVHCGGPGNTPALLARFGSPGYAPCQLSTTVPIDPYTPLGASYDTEPSFSTALNMHWRQSFGELTSITGLNRFHYVSVGQQDLGTINTVNGYNANINRQFSQELRYQTKLDLPVNFLGGAYYQQSGYENENDANVYPIAVEDSLFTFDKLAHQHDQTESVFLEAQWKIIDPLELDVSDRYTHERKTANWVETSVAPYAPAQATYGPAGAYVTVPPLTFSNNSPQAILTWKPTSDVMAYAAYKTGYLSGGFNINTQATPKTDPQTLTFGAEKVKGGEIGTKFWLLDRRFQVNADVYYYEYNGLQESIFNPALITYTVQNAAQSVDKGVELNGTAALGRGFSLQAGVNYNDSYFTDYIGQCLPGTVAGVAPCSVKLSASAFGQNYDGVHTSNAPLWSGLVKLSNVTKLTNGTTLRTSVSGLYSTSYIVDDILGQPGYVKIDASISLEHGPWTFALIGQNLGNHLECGLASPQPLSTSTGEIRCILDRPRQERLEIGYQF
jgi:iron complex outermembrane receptor protein